MDKFLKIGFSVFAVFALIFGFLRLGQNLKLTFNEDDSTAAKTSQELIDETKQRLTDTDADGLSDWDELNVYSTSPYLKDSDSDGISDSEEIKNNTDPNCSTGKVCGSTLAPATGATGGAEATTTATTPLTAEESAALQAELNNLSPEEIRTLLKEGGVTDSDLESATDEDLRNLLNEALKQTAEE